MGKVQLQLKLSQNTDFVQRDLSPWDGQTEILQNTGIERDGGITNLYTVVDSNSEYVESLYCSNGNRVRLKYDSLNKNLRVFSGARDIGQVPAYAVKRRELIKATANDVLSTISGTLLVLSIFSSTATIEEVNALTLERVQIRSFAIPSTITDGMFVRNKAPTFANVTSIVGINAGLQFQILLESGTSYTPTGQSAITPTSQIFAYYENGWIVGAQLEANGKIYMLRSDGTQEATVVEGSYLSVDHNRTSGAVLFRAQHNPIATASLDTYAYIFFPPSAPLGAWGAVSSLIVSGMTTPTEYKSTYGASAVVYGTPKLSWFNALGNSLNVSCAGTMVTLPEIFGTVDNGTDVKIKSHTILGLTAYLSASFNINGIGVPITEIGEISSLYYPQVVYLADGTIRTLYRRGDASFAFVDISNDLTISRLQEIAPGVVKINTVSALSIADSNDNTLHFSGNAYNGCAFISTATIGPTAAIAFAARYKGKWGQSVDTGYKDIGTAGAFINAQIPEAYTYSPTQESIDIYIGAPPASLEYAVSIKGILSRVFKSELQNTLYVDNQVIPPPIGAEITNQAISLIASTAIRQLSLDGYELGNEVSGTFVAFRLFGSLYLFDGEKIYMARIVNGIMQGIDSIADALGLMFISASPTVAWFISSFDNSLYSFDGGQSVNKVHRYNRAEPIWGGVYNTKENTLALFSDGSIFWIRDGLISQTHLPFSSPFEAFTTVNGIWIVKDSYSIQYRYNPAALGSDPVVTLDLDGGTWGTAYADVYDGGTWGTQYQDTIDGGTFGGNEAEVTPLTWQSKFLGIDERTAQTVERVLFRFYKEDLAQTDITITYDYFTEEGQFSETQTYTVGDVNNPWDSQGYAFIEFVPAQKRSIGAAFAMTCPTKIVFLDSFAEVTELARNVAKNRK